MKLLLIIGSGVAAVGLFLLATASGDTAFFAQQYPLLLALNAALAVLLAALVIYQLVALARQVSKHPHGRDYDLLLASGEQVAVATLALALQGKGVPAIALTGAQCNIRTDGSWNRARIQSIEWAGSPIIARSALGSARPGWPWRL